MFRGTGADTNSFKDFNRRWMSEFKKKNNAYEVWGCSGLRYWAQAERGAARAAAGSAVDNFEGGGEAITQTPAARSITAAEAPSATTTSRPFISQTSQHSHRPQLTPFPMNSFFLAASLWPFSVYILPRILSNVFPSNVCTSASARTYGYLWKMNLMALDRHGRGETTLPSPYACTEVL